ncbi:RbsD/FucU family protein [Phycicoccus duodecadis]|uniref:L-fucose mutarotase n=1 Tax=Phycicoccus duodecadis TaxID=173053 RepID=A0A2N3YI94_9MICO|nr:RbsD/FucU family protein [Phycicoccus duodecadis]PKW26572.1 L-fucose mutarotase [Phycicoccus duodecadis]
MLRTTLIHPPLLAALAACGHGSKVLLTDANYPVKTGVAPHATVVHLALRPGTVGVIEVLTTLLDTVVVESAAVMAPPDGTEPAVFEEFGALLEMPLERLSRHDFYTAARTPDVGVVVHTGEQRLFANLMLTLGVVHGRTNP